MSCTTILVGKNASYDGSTIIARDDDSGSGRYDPKRFVAVAPEDQPRHYRSVLSHVEIELPDNPCRYTIAPNVLNNRGILAEAGANEHNVAMSATETIAVNERVLGADPMVELRPAVGEPDSTDYQAEQPGGIGEEDIITLVLPYVTTAREGVARLAELLETYGTYESNGIIISDVNEIWYVETIGGHHWIARHLDRTISAAASGGFGFQSTSAFGNGGMNGGGNSSSGAALGHNHFNPRTAFGTATTKDHIYNTPRAWYMQRYLNPSEDWDSPAARYTPASDDIPWCRVPENAVTLEDVDFLMSAHFEGTPYDPYGTLGTPESRHRYRPIGINRTGHMVAMQIRPYAPEASRSIMWISYGSGPFTAATPFYANVDDTPAYLRDTTPEVSTGNLYWANRLIAALADAHFYETSNAIEGFAESARAYGHRLAERTDAELREMSAQTSVSESQERAGAADITENASIATIARLQQSNEEMAEYLRTHVTKLLNDVLYTSSNLMHNSCAMSDRWN